MRVNSFIKYMNSQVSGKGVGNRPFFILYQQGINLTLENRLVQANQHFHQSLEEIKKLEEDQLQHYSYILKRIANNQRRLGQNKQAQATLYEIIKHKKYKKINSSLIFADYDNLFKHMLTYDLSKATTLAKALLTPQQRKQMPNFYLKLFQFNLANAYLFAGNYQDAKKKYYEMLDANPQGNLKSYAYNNLALACWWHKNPIVAEHVGDIQKTEKDFSKTNQLLSQSISIGEKIQEIEDDEKLMRMKQTLDEASQLHEDVQFKSSASLFPIMNKAQFLLENDPIQRGQIMYWLHKSLKLSQRAKNQTFFDRNFIQINLLNNELAIVEEKLPSLIQKYRAIQEFAEEMYYCRSLALLLKNKKQTQSKQYEKRADLLGSVLPRWTPKFRYVGMDRLDLIN